MSRKIFACLSVMVALVTVLSSCAAPTPEVITKIETVVVEKQQVVEKPVVQTVVVEKEKVIEKPVAQTVIVEKEKVVEKPVEKVVEKVVTPTPSKYTWLTLGGTWELPPAYNGNPFAPGNTGPAYWYIWEPFFYYVPVSAQVLPVLAESYENTEKAFTVKLVKNAKWHDGTPMTSKDVRCTFLLRKLQNASIWNYISDVQTPDDYTVVFPWKERTAFAVQFFAVEPIRAAYHLFGKWSDQVPAIMDNADKQKELLADLQKFRPEKPIGTGPFFVQTVTASDLIMPKFKDYRNANKVAFEGVKYVLAMRHEVGMAYALSGDIHGCGAPLRADFWEALKARRPDLRVVAVTDLSEFGVTFNTRKAPYSDYRVRKALTHATDRKTLTEVAFPTGSAVTPYSHPILQSMEKAWLSEDVMKKMTTYEYDPAKAEALLKEAGFSKGSDGKWRLPDGKIWTIEINCPAGYGDWVLGCENLAAQWTKFGITAKCQPKENAVWWPSALAGEYEVGFLWAGTFWSTAHPYTALQRHFLGDGGKEQGIFDAIDKGTAQFKGPDGKVVDVKALVNELGTLPEMKRQKEIVDTLAYVANEFLGQMIWVEKQFHFCLYENEVAGYPPSNDGLWLLAPGGMERVWVWLMINGTIKPK